MAGLCTLDSGNYDLAGKMKAEVTVQKKPSFRNAVRKRLSDITNLQHGTRSPSNKDDNQIPIPTIDNIERLHKENVMLLRLVAEKNKIIELTGAELAKMRLNLQKVQQQNWQLAQANSRMLADLNLGKDKLKALQHELGCKAALISVKDSELREKLKKKPCQKTRIDCKDTEGGETFPETNKISIVNKRLQSRSLPLGSSTAREQLDTREKGDEKSSHPPKKSLDIKTELEQTEEKVDNKRRCLRRQSTKFKPKLEDPAEDLFELEDAKFPVNPLQDDKVQGNDATSSTTNEDQEEMITSNSICRTPAPRSSIGRPTRKVTEKVQSYKERPINIKLRREI